MLPTFMDIQSGHCTKLSKHLLSRYSKFLLIKENALFGSLWDSAFNCACYTYPEKELSFLSTLIFFSPSGKPCSRSSLVHWRIRWHVDEWCWNACHRGSCNCKYFVIYSAGYALDFVIFFLLPQIWWVVLLPN